MRTSLSSAAMATYDSAAQSDILEVEQLLARYAVGMTKDDVDAVMDVFTPDGTYSAFGDTYSLADFPTLVAAAPKGLFMVGTPALALAGAAGPGTGAHPPSFLAPHAHASRVGGSTEPPTPPA